MDRQEEMKKVLEEKGKKQAQENLQKLEKLAFDPKGVLEDLYPVYKCQNLFRKMKGRDKRHFSVLDEVTKDLLTKFYEKAEGLADEDEIKTYAQLFMEDSQIGRKNKEGQFFWQQLDGEESDGKLDLAWLLYQEEKNNGYSQSAHTTPLFPGDEDENFVPTPQDHPINDPNVLITIHKELGKKMVGEEANRMTLFCCVASSWFNEDPTGAAGLGVSSIGKTFAINTVLNHFPEVTGIIFNDDKKQKELHNKPMVFRLMDIKLAALFRTSDSIFDRKVIYQGEKADAKMQKSNSEKEEVSRVLRQWQSQGRYNRILSEQEKTEFGWKSSFVDKRAKISLIMESAETIEEQDVNRTIPLIFDESKEQTEGIIKFIAENKGKPSDPIVKMRKEPSKIIQQIIEKFPERFYDECDYENPYYNYLSEILLKKYNYHPHTRRMTAYVFGLIETITKIQWKNRKLIDNSKVNTGRLVYSNATDNLLGMMLVWGSMEQAITQTSQTDYLYLGMMKEALATNSVKLLKNAFFNPDGSIKFQEEGEWWTINEMAKVIKKGKERTREAVMKLVELGFIKSKSMGKSGRYWKHQIDDDMIRTETSIGLVDFLPFFVPMEYHNDPCFLGKPDFSKYSYQVIYPNSEVFNFFVSKLPISPVQLYNITYICVREYFSGFQLPTIEEEFYILNPLPIRRSGLLPKQREIWVFFDPTKVKTEDRSVKVSNNNTSLSQSPGTNIINPIKNTFLGQIKEEMNRLARENEDGDINYSDLVKFTSSKGMMMEALEEILESLAKEGEIYEPRPKIFHLSTN